MRQSPKSQGGHCPPVIFHDHAIQPVMRRSGVGRGSTKVALGELIAQTTNKCKHLAIELWHCSIWLPRDHHLKIKTDVLFPKNILVREAYRHYKERHHGPMDFSPILAFHPVYYDSHKNRPVHSTIHYKHGGQTEGKKRTQASSALAKISYSLITFT